MYMVEKIRTKEGVMFKKFFLLSAIFFTAFLRADTQSLDRQTFESSAYHSSLNKIKQRYLALSATTPQFYVVQLQKVIYDLQKNPAFSEIVQDFSDPAELGEVIISLSENMDEKSLFQLYFLR